MVNTCIHVLHILIANTMKSYPTTFIDMVHDFKSI